MKKLIAINLSKDEAIAALVEYAVRQGKITYQGPAEMSAMTFATGGKIDQVRVEVAYESEPDGQTPNAERRTPNTE